MKVKIKGNALAIHANSIPAHAGYTTAQFSWRDALGQITGQWVEVETEHLFEDQFNLVPTPGSANGLRVMHESIDDIDFEGKDYNWFKQQVTERYEKDWPGRKPNFYHVNRILHRAGKRKTDPVVCAYLLRGYDMGGDPYTLNITAEDFDVTVDRRSYDIKYKGEYLTRYKDNDDSAYSKLRGRAVFKRKQEYFDTCKAIIDSIVADGNSGPYYQDVCKIYLHLSTC